MEMLVFYDSILIVCEINRCFSASECAILNESIYHDIQNQFHKKKFVCNQKLISLSSFFLIILYVVFFIFIWRSSCFHN